MFKFAAIAAVASFTLVACNNNNQATEDTIDSTAIEQIAEDEMIAEPISCEQTDTIKEEAAPAAKPAPAKKQTAKKEVTKEDTKVIGTEVKTPEAGTTTAPAQNNKQKENIKKDGKVVRRTL